MSSLQICLGVALSLPQTFYLFNRTEVPTEDKTTISLQTLTEVPLGEPTAACLVFFNLINSLHIDLLRSDVINFSETLTVLASPTRISTISIDRKANYLFFLPINSASYEPLLLLDSLQLNRDN